MIEKHYTIKEMRELLNLSFERCRQLVMNEPGVLRIPPAGKTIETAGALMYRIPESVIQRILRRNANPA